MRGDVEHRGPSPPALVVDRDLPERTSEQHSSDSVVELHDFVPYGLMGTSRAAILVIRTFVLAALCLPGCGEGQQRRYDDAVLALRDGRNETALAESRRVVSSSDSTLRCDAALIAGVAATRVGATADARRYLKIAATSSDDVVAGRALVQQGVLERGEGRRLEAAASFARAADRLGPEEAGRALLLAAEDYEAMGRRTTARRCLDRAAGLSSDTADTARTRLAETGYTIQFGSFSSRDNAARQAAAVSREVARRGIGDVRIRSEDDGWKVQAGVFRDRAAAGRALRRLDRTDAMVVPIGS